ncbi:MAG TPA: hypothetical protein VHZ09_05255 [Acidobacteriaceae bacterium]|jgi:hypothetical protein|nr:hypothetical protein [Acidobacteriaceae bacterium]
MKPLSPVDAISPAFSRARTLLTPPGLAPGTPAPFRFWFFLKIAIIAALTQPNVYGFLFGMFFEGLGLTLAAASIGVHHTDSSFILSGGARSVFAAVILILGFVALAFCIFLAWLWCRLRFALFDLVVYRHGQVARSWSPYGSQAGRFLGLMVLVALTLLLLLAVTAGPLILHFLLAVRHLTPQQINSNPALVLSHILPMYGVIFFFILIASLADAITQDFILPPLAIEDAPLGSAFSRFFQFLRAHFGRCVLYLLVRLGLELGLTWVGMMGLFVVFGIALLGGGGVGFLLFHLLWHAGPGGITLFVLYCAAAGLLLIALYLILTFALYGAVALVKQCFAVYFYGSYYPALGDRLEPPPDVPAGLVPPNSLPLPLAPLPDPHPLG